MSAKRAVIRLQLEISAKQALDRLCERRGMTQIAVLSRMVKWFVTQDEIVQASILGLLSENTLGDLSRMLLARLADDDEAVGDAKLARETREGKEAKESRESREPR